MPRLLRDGVSYDSGTALQWQLALKNSGNAKMTGLYNVDTPNVDDVTANASIDWKFMNTSYAFDRRELAMNSDTARIFELLTIRRQDAFAAAADLLESQFWGKAHWHQRRQDHERHQLLDALCECRRHWWLPRDQPDGFSSVAGLDVTAAANARWRHFTASYETYTKTESSAGAGDALTQRMRLAMRKTGFMPPVSPA